MKVVDAFYSSYGETPARPGEHPDAGQYLSWTRTFRSSTSSSLPLSSTPNSVAVGFRHGTQHTKPHVRIARTSTQRLLRPQRIFKRSPSATFATSLETCLPKQGRRPDSYQPGATPQVLGRFLFIGLKARFIWSGPSALLFCHSPILGRCPRLVWSAPSALGPMEHMEFLISMNAAAVE